MCSGLESRSELRKGFALKLQSQSLTAFWLCILLIIFSPVEAAKREISEYKIQAYDQITMMLKKNDATSEVILNRVPVLESGHIILGRYGEIKIEGLTIDDLKAKFPEAEFIVHHQSKYVSVIGEVMKPGSYAPESISTVYDAIAVAGGFTRLSNKRKVKVVHQHKDGRREVYFINFPKEVFKAYDKGIGEDRYLIAEGDLISVSKSRWKQAHAFVTNLLNTVVQVSTIGLISGAVSSAIN